MCLQTRVRLGGQELALNQETRMNLPMDNRTPGVQNQQGSVGFLSLHGLLLPRWVSKLHHEPIVVVPTDLPHTPACVSA